MRKSIHVHVKNVWRTFNIIIIKLFFIFSLVEDLNKYFILIEKKNDTRNHHEIRQQTISKVL